MPLKADSGCFISHVSGIPETWKLPRGGERGEILLRETWLAGFIVKKQSPQRPGATEPQPNQSISRKGAKHVLSSKVERDAKEDQNEQRSWSMEGFYGTGCFISHVSGIPETWKLVAR